MESPPQSSKTATSVADVVENHPLVQLVGDHARARILVALYTAAEPLNPHRIVERAGLGSNSTWYRNKDELLETGLVVQSGNAGNAPLYRLAKDDPRVDALDVLVERTSAAIAEQL